MSDSASPANRRFGKASPIRPADVVRMAPLRPDAGLPLVVQPNVPELDLVEWARGRRAQLEPLLWRHGALLFRGFRVDGTAGFHAFVKDSWGEPLEYMEQTSPRHKVHGNIYTSTDYPPEHRIPLHNENSYSSVWPLKIMFFCVTPADEGGETPLADVRRVLQRVPAPVRERFARQGWILVRNLGTGYSLSWQTVFQTDERGQVDRLCRARGIEHEWLSDERLRLRQRRPALATHPVTGETAWFNHAAFFHISSRDAGTREGLLAELAEEDLPYNTYYGDGAPIEPETLEQIRAAYDAETVAFPWQRHDVLLVDNMLAAHARSAFRGPRSIVVAMTEPCSDMAPRGEDRP